MLLGGQGLGKGGALGHGHGGHIDALGQIAQPGALVAAGGEQDPGPGLVGGLQEGAQLLLFLGGPGRLCALGETGDGLDVVPDPEHRHLGHHRQGDLSALLQFVDGAPGDIVLFQQGLKGLAEITQHLVEGLEGLEAGEEYRAALQAIGLGVPAGELHGGHRLAAAGVGVEQNNLVVVEGAVEGEQGLVTTDETDVRRWREIILRGGALAQVKSPVVLLVLPGWQELDGGGLEYHRHRPVLQGEGAVGDAPLWLGVELAPPLAHRRPQAQPPGQVAVELENELGGGDHPEVVAHRHHPGDPGVHHLLGQGAEGACMAGPGKMIRELVRLEYSSRAVRLLTFRG